MAAPAETKPTPPETKPVPLELTLPSCGILQTISGSPNYFSYFVPFDKVCYLGRDPNVCQVSVAHPFVGAKHLSFGASLVPDTPTRWYFWMKDLSSTNGTCINGNRITPSVEYAIGKGDIISIGGANRLERSTASCDEKRVEFGLHPWIINSFHSLYNVYESVGQGGFGQVYRCRSRATGITHAVKLIGHSEHTRPSDIHRECAIAQGLVHENVVRTIEVYHENEVSYLVMEWAPFGTLSDLLRNARNFRVGEGVAQEIMLQLCRGIKHIHSLGLVHRDLKPANILVMSVKPLIIKIADFGITKVVSDNMSVAGTPPYMAPEVVLGCQYNEQADCFSLGCILFQLLAGQAPYGNNDVTFGSSGKGVHDRRGPPPFHLVSPDLFSPQAKQAICGLLKREATERLSISGLYTSTWLANARRRAFRCNHL